MFNKKLKELVKSANVSADYFAEKCHELDKEIEVQRSLKRHYRRLFEGLEEKNNSSDYFRMKKSDYNQLINENVILHNEYQALKVELEESKKMPETFTINLNTSTFDINELTKKIIENINKGRY